MARSKSDVWMPIYIGDYLADTMRLSTVQHGAYFLLMMEYWRQGPLPDNADELSAIVRADRKTWDKSIWPVLKRYFTLGDDGLLHQKRADEERANAYGLKAKRTAAAQARWNKTTEQEPCKTDANASAKQTDVDEQSGCIMHALRAPASPSPSPSSLRSEHSLPSVESESTRKPKSEKPKRACRLPADWQPTPEQIQFARDNQVDPIRTAEVFRDYWLGVPGAKGCKADWDATWRNWVRREDGMRTPAAASGGAFRSNRPKTAADRADEHAAYMLEKYAGGVR